MPLTPVEAANAPEDVSPIDRLSKLSAQAGELIQGVGLEITDIESRYSYRIRSEIEERNRRIRSALETLVKARMKLQEAHSGIASEQQEAAICHVFSADTPSFFAPSTSPLSLLKSLTDERLTELRSLRARLLELGSAQPKQTNTAATSSFPDDAPQACKETASSASTVGSTVIRASSSESADFERVEGFVVTASCP